MQKINRQVLMLEEDTDDRFLTEETLKELGIAHPVRFFNNSDELLNALSQTRTPSVLLINYNSSRDNGMEVLQQIKSNEAYQHLPVIILSDNNLPHYVQQCYAHGASTFIQKPGTVEGTREKIKTFFKYWLEVAEL